MRTFGGIVIFLMLGVAAFSVLYLAVCVMFIWPLQDRRRRG